MAVGDLKARLRAKFTRRYSATPSVSSTDGESQLADPKTNSPGSLNSRAGHIKQHSVFSSTIRGKRKEDAVSETPGLAAVPQGSSASELELHSNDLQPQ